VDAAAADLNTYPQSILVGIFAATILFALGMHILAVVEPVLLYRDSAPLREDKKFDASLSALVPCGDRLYLFGDRTITEDSIVIYRDAIAWCRDSGGSWEQTDYQGGDDRIHYPGVPSHRAFEGALCEDGIAIAYGEDTLGSREPGLSPDGALWRANGLGWTPIQPHDALGGEGPQRVLSLVRRNRLIDTPEERPPSASRQEIDRSYQVILGLGEGRGVRCLVSNDLNSWSNVGDPAMKGWYVDAVTSNQDLLVAVAHRNRTDPSRTRETTIFQSDNCTTWEERPLPSSLRFDKWLTSISHARGQWFLSGYTSWSDVKNSAAILAFGSDAAHFVELDLTALGENVHRGLFATGGDGDDLLALGFDFSVPASGGSPSNFAIPVVFERTKAIRIPFVGVRYGPSHSNVALDR